MKTKTWIVLLGSFALLCTCLALLLQFSRQPARCAEVSSDGRHVLTLDLRQDGEYRIESHTGWNLIRVENGSVRVIEASCTSQDCVKCGAASSGAPIVCLPNRLVITFSDSNDYDAMIG